MRNGPQYFLMVPAGASRRTQEEMTVKGTRIKNTSDFKIEATGYRKDLVSNKKVAIEWKSIIVDTW